MPLRVDKLKQTLKSSLAAVGISAHITSEPVRGTKLHRFFVISDQFEAMSHSERQEIVWRIAQESLSSLDRAQVSIIRTLTMDEIGETVPTAKGKIHRRHRRAS